MKTEEDFSAINKKKRRNLVKQLQSVDSSEGNGVLSTNDWESVDMKKQLHPIGYYINDREEMIRQMFSVIQGERLKNMLPVVLKDVDLDELKADCLIHLVGMSTKRIRAILEGHDLEISSEESDSENDSDVNSASKHNFQTKSKDAIHKKGSKSTNKADQLLEDNCSVISGDDTLEIGLTQSDLCDDLLESNDDSKLKKTKKRKLNESKHQRPKRTLETAEIPTSKKQVIGSNSGDLKSKEPDKTVNSDGSENKGKTLLEILELEMRARAIRALLQHDDSPKEALTPEAGEKNKIPIDEIMVSVKTEPKTIDLTNDEPLLVEETAIEIIEIDHDERTDEENVSSTHCVEDTTVKSDRGPLPTQSMLNSDKIELNEFADFEIYDKMDLSVGEDNENDSANNSWAQRWLEKKSKDVKRLVTISKMCTNIRNKMKRPNKKIMKATNLSENDNKHVNMPTEFKGSIEEYNMLTGSLTPQSSKTDDDMIINSKQTINESSKIVSDEKEEKCDEIVR